MVGASLAGQADKEGWPAGVGYRFVSRQRGGRGWGRKEPLSRNHASTRGAHLPQNPRKAEW
jgi:hypothetical protein